MQKNFKSYCVIWAICLIAFNAIAFIVPGGMKTNFWIGYLFITLAFSGQLVCAKVTFKADNAKKFFYNFSLISISFIGAVIMLIIGGITMAVPIIPVWVGIILCLLDLAFTAIAVINASVASGVVSDIDKKIKADTLFVKTLTADAMALMSKAQTQQQKDITQKVYETIRYSDPVSNDALHYVESQITICFKEFESAICENRENATIIGQQLIILINERNTKCELFK